MIGFFEIVTVHSLRTSLSIIDGPFISEFDVRFDRAEDAMRAIQGMNGRKPRGFEAEIVVKLARFDHGQSQHVLSKVADRESSGNVLRGHSPPSGQPFDGNVPRNHFAASFGAVGGGQQSPMGGGFMSTQRSPMALNGNNNGHFNVRSSTWLPPPRMIGMNRNGMSSPSFSVQQQQQWMAGLNGMGGMSGMDGVYGVSGGGVAANGGGNNLSAMSNNVLQQMQQLNLSTADIPDHGVGGGMAFDSETVSAENGAAFLLAAQSAKPWFGRMLEGL